MAVTVYENDSRLNWLNVAWAAATNYNVHDALQHNGTSYRCIVAHTSAAATEPGIGVDWATRWAVVAAKGETGAPGVDGTNGTNGVLSEVQNEGIALTDAATMDFIGPAVNVTSDGTKYTVDVSGAASLDALTDVDTSTTPPTDGQGLVWDDALGLWVPADLASGGGGGATTFVGARALRNAVQSIPNAAWTPVDLDVSSFDSGGIVNLTTNRLTIPTTGKYYVGIKARWAASATGIRAIRAEHYNSAGTLIQSSRAQEFQHSVNSINSVSMTAQEVFEATAGDYIVFAVYQSSGGFLDLMVSSGATDETNLISLVQLAGGGGAPQYAKLTAAYTVPEFNVTLGNVPGLLLPVAATKYYEVECLIIVSANGSGADLKMGFAVPAGVSGKWAAPNGYPNSGDAYNVPAWMDFASNTGFVLGTNTPGRVLLFKGTLITGATVGSIQAQIAQGTSTGATVQAIQPGSYLKLTEIP